MDYVAILEVAAGFFAGYLISRFRTPSHEKRCQSLDGNVRCVFPRYHSGPHKAAWYVSYVDYWENAEEKAIEREIGIRK